MAIGLSALQTVLEEGNKDDWFASPFILRLAVVAAVFLSAFVAIELNVEKPLVNLRLLKSRNFGIGVVVNILMGFALFGTVFVLPQYLGQVQRYNAEQIGNVVKRQALIMGFSDTFVVIGVILSIAAVTLLLARKPNPAAEAGAH